MSKKKSKLYYQKNLQLSLMDGPVAIHTMLLFLATFLHNRDTGFKIVLLSVSPFENEDLLDAAE